MNRGGREACVSEALAMSSSRASHGGADKDTSKREKKDEKKDKAKKDKKKEDALSPGMPVRIGPSHIMPYFLLVLILCL